MAKLGTVWERATEFAGERAGALAPIALAAFVVPNAASSCLGALAPALPPATRMALAGIILLLSVVTLWGSLAVMALATGEPGTASAARLATRRLGPALLVSIVLGVVAALLAAPLPAILLARGYDVVALAAGQTGNVVIDPQTSSMVALYMLVLLPVGLFLFTRLVLVSPVVLREAVSLGAIRRSWVLTRRHGWRIFGTLLLFVVIAGVAQLAARSVAGSVFALLLGGGDGLTTSFALTAIVTACVQGVVMLLLAAFQAKLYAARIAETVPAA
ncbi:hypothetical protein [Sphingomonas sp. R1]|uniref:hypothetical protein n=1 Tax=Sphingomonas sp. R1 TaxID=399176 RepID=UPI00222497AC|nr:hypothetical protein [Sphingomonas sp. R1]UYY78977.1 hypothetical protein OIM94_08365 [Sphingomonas sp. R1]